MLVSILIHELGHSLAFRRYGVSSHIVLYHFGGVAVPDTYGSAWGGSRGMSPQQHIIIAAAGPALQMLSAVALLFVLRAGNFAIPFVWDFGPLEGSNPLPNDAVRTFVFQFLYVSIFWALLNLLPVYPLDGGQIARDLFQMFGNAGQAIQNSLMLSVVAGAGMALWSLSRGEQYIGIMFALLAYSSYQTLSQYGGGGFGRQW